MKSRASFTFIVLVLPGAVTAISAGTAETVRARRLVVCLDGTQNSPEQEVKGFPGHKLYKPTTVLKTLRAILPVGKDGVSQISYYSDGVGSMIGDDTGYSRFAVGVDRIFGGATALGYDSRVKSAYRFLVANYQAGDQIFVFGFSRGAAEAQTLVRFVEWVGSRLPEHDVGGLLFKKNEYWIPELYEGFKHSCTADEVFEKILRRNRNSTGVKEAAIAGPGPAKPACRDLEPPEASPPTCCGPRGMLDDPQKAQIEFLGVYDTVVAVGSRWAPDCPAGKQDSYLVNEIPPKIVKTIRQALAIDERRCDFWPQIWQPKDHQPKRTVRRLVQLWFPGVHSNVGGGYEHDQLANGALMWMLTEAKKADLSLDEDYLCFFEHDKDPCGDTPSRPDSYTLWARVADLIRGKSGHGVRKLATWDHDGSWEKSGFGFHESLAALLACDHTYRPKNLLEYLAKNPDRINCFPSHRREICRIVDDFNAKVRTPNSCQASPCVTAAARN